MTTIELTYNKTKMSALKEELKTMAAEIKQAKPKLRECQSRVDKENLDWWGTEENSEERKFLKQYCSLSSKLHSLQFQFRHKLIAYSLTRGKKYEQIERTVREGNEPNWTFIKGLQDELSS